MLNIIAISLIILLGAVLWLVAKELHLLLSDIRLERDWYRDRYTEREGIKYSASFEKVTPVDELQQVAFDATWTVDDHDLFHNWCQDQINKGADPAILRDEWQRIYGSSPPLSVLTV